MRQPRRRSKATKLPHAKLLSSLHVSVSLCLCHLTSLPLLHCLRFFCAPVLLCLSRSLHTSAPSWCLTDNWGHSQSSYSVQVVCSQKFLLRWNQKKGSEVEWRNTIIEQLFICLHFISFWSVAFIYTQLYKTKQWSAAGSRSLSSVAVSHHCTAGYRHLHLVCILPWQLVTDIFTTWVSLNVLQSQD